MWQPVAFNDTSATVYPTYYSLLFIADLIADIAAPTIYELSAFENNTLAIYALYDGAMVDKIVVLNLAFYDDTKTTRGVQMVDVSSVLGKNVQVSRFTGPKSTTVGTANVTWMEQTFSTGKGLGARTVENHNDGIINVADSEAVIIERHI